MVNLKHRSASGVLTNLWELDPVRGFVLATLQFGSAEPVDVEIPVCSDVRKRVGAFALSRVSEDVWRVAPAFFDRDGDGWRTRSSTYGPNLPGEFLYLTHAPPAISFELEAL